MNTIPFLPPFEALPSVIPVFPLPGALLLPGGRLPLNVFEPRYLAMVDDALRTHRLIGMIQPRESLAARSTPAGPALHAVGCAGKLISWQETQDGRFLINLSGLIRFHVVEEVSSMRGYRQVKADWQAYHTDWPGQEPLAAAGAVDRDKLRNLLERFLRDRHLTADWSTFKDAPDDALVNGLSMACPFAAAEKQALLEAPDLATRSRLLTSLLEMAGPLPQGGTTPRH